MKDWSRSAERMINAKINIEDMDPALLQSKEGGGGRGGGCKERGGPLCVADNFNFGELGA